MTNAFCSCTNLSIVLYRGKMDQITIEGNNAPLTAKDVYYISLSD